VKIQYQFNEKNIVDVGERTKTGEQRLIMLFNTYDFSSISV